MIVGLLLKRISLIMVLNGEHLILINVKNEFALMS